MSTRMENFPTALCMAFATGTSHEFDNINKSHDASPASSKSEAEYLEIVKLLIAHGADVNARDIIGMTPILIGCQK